MDGKSNVRKEAAGKARNEPRRQGRREGRKEEAGKKWGRVEEGLKGRRQKKEGTE